MMCSNIARQREPTIIESKDSPYRVTGGIP
jgi:hypothetical protein